MQYRKKEVSNEVEYLDEDMHENFQQIDSMIFDGGWSSTPKVPKIASLQCLLFLMEVARLVQSNQNREFVIFLQSLKKKVSQLLLCSVVKTFKYFTEVQSRSLLLVNHEPTVFIIWGERYWNENLWKCLKEEIFLEI